MTLVARSRGWSVLSHHFCTTHITASQTLDMSASAGVATDIEAILHDRIARACACVGPLPSSTTQEQLVNGFCRVDARGSERLLSAQLKTMQSPR